MKKQVKQYVSIILIAMIVLVGCGKTSNEKLEKESKKESGVIELTLDNYETYFDISEFARTASDGTIQYTSNSWFQNGISYNYGVSGKTSNYDYNDVKFTVKLTIDVHTRQWDSHLGAMREGTDKTLQYQFECAADIAGNGSYGDEVFFKDDVIDITEYKYEVVDIVGTLSVPGK